MTGILFPYNLYICGSFIYHNYNYAENFATRIEYA
jgi:hypothetical protein